MISGEENWCTTVLRTRKQVLYYFWEKEIGVLLFSGKGHCCIAVFKRRDLVLYRAQEKETGALLFSRIRKLVYYCS